MNLEATFLKSKKRLNLIYKTYRKLEAHFGKQNWWPGETSFEIIVGAILTQQTTWKNVEKAITALKKEGYLNEFALWTLPTDILENIIKVTGFYKVKARRLRNFLYFYREEFNFDMRKMSSLETFTLREKLLNVNGIGKETADSILLYALNKPIFVVDSYTRRFLKRYALIDKDLDYDEMRVMFEEALKGESMEETISNYKEMHALMVELGKNFCKAKPLCRDCPLMNECEKVGVYRI